MLDDLFISLSFYDSFDSDPPAAEAEKNDYGLVTLNEVEEVTIDGQSGLNNGDDLSIDTYEIDGAQVRAYPPLQKRALHLADDDAVLTDIAGKTLVGLVIGVLEDASPVVASNQLCGNGTDLFVAETANPDSSGNVICPVAE